MIAITKRLRLFRGVPDSKEELTKFREQARATLNKPYHFEPKAQVKPWELFGTDPTSGFFKPFSKLNATPPTSQPLLRPVKTFSALSVLKRELANLDWRRISVPMGIAGLALSAFLLWQIFATSSSLQGVIGQNPVATEPPSADVSSLTPVGEIVPPGTELEPGGPYTGTGSTQPSTLSPNSGNNTNLNQGGTLPVSPSSPATCPDGMVCSGRALDGSDCTTSNPCRIVKLTTPLATGGTIIQSGQDFLGNSCPCVLTH